MRIIRLKKVLDCTGLGRSTVYKKMAEGTFPASVSLGGKARGWVAEEVEEWIYRCIGERDKAELENYSRTSRPLGGY